MSWKDIIGIDLSLWEKIITNSKEGSELIEHLLPMLIEHINQKEELVKNQQLETLKRKYSKEGMKDIFSAVSEIFWFTNLTKKSWDVIIEPDYPDRGPDCSGKFDNKEVYFEIVSPAGVRSEIIKRCFTLLGDLKAMGLPKNFQIDIDISRFDLEFDSRARNILRDKIRVIDLQPCPFTNFYLIGEIKENDVFFEISEKDPGFTKNFGCVMHFMKFENIPPTVGMSDAFWTEYEFIKWLLNKMEKKLKSQIKKGRENYLVIDVPSCYGSSPSSSFEDLTKNVKDKERLNRVFGLFILIRKLEQGACFYTIKLISNPQKVSLNSESILNLRGEERIMLHEKKQV